MNKDDRKEIKNKRLKKMRNEKRARKARKEKIEKFRSWLNRETVKKASERRDQKETVQYILSTIATTVWMNVIVDVLPNGSVKTVLTFLNEWGLM